MLFLSVNIWVSLAYFVFIYPMHWLHVVHCLSCFCWYIIWVGRTRCLSWSDRLNESVRFNICVGLVQRCDEEMIMRQVNCFIIRSSPIHWGPVHLMPSLIFTKRCFMDYSGGVFNYFTDPLCWNVYHYFIDWSLSLYICTFFTDFQFIVVVISLSSFVLMASVIGDGFLKEFLISLTAIM